MRGRCAGNQLQKCDVAGGSSLWQGPMDIFDSGVLATMVDPGGAVFSMWQPKAHKGFQVMIGA